MTRRFQDALDIQNGGACNPSGIARTLYEACKECLAEGGHQRTDPAIRLIVHQLYSLCGGWQIDNDTTTYGALMKACEERAASPKAA